MFYFSAFVLVLITIACILPSLRNQRPIRVDDTKSQNALIARQRLDEIERNATESNQPETDWRSAKSEIETALAEDISSISSTPFRPAPVVVSSFAVISLVITTIVIYTQLGSPIHFDESKTQVKNPISVSPETTDITALIKQLEQRLADEPDNARGWELAGRTYMSMGSYNKAEQAYLRLNELESGNADFLSALADASIMANGNVYSDTAQAAVSQALQLNPRHINSLWIAGLGAGSVGENQQAIEYFLRLKPLLVNDEESLLNLERLIAENQSSLSSKAPIDNDTNRTEEGIHVEVTIADGIAQTLKGSESVFIFARAVNGPPAPLAVAKYSFNSLPPKIILTAEMAMIPGMDINTFDDIEVLARISNSGNPLPQPGDYESNTASVSDNTSNQPIKLVIEIPVKHEGN